MSQRLSTSSSNTVGQNSMIMAIGTAASRVTGQIRSILLAAAIGTTGFAANAYQTGSTVPQVVFTLISGGIFNAVLVPQIVRTLKHHDAQDRLNKLITLAMALLIGITAVMMVLTPCITYLYVNPNWTPQQRALVNAFTLWCMPQIFFYGVYLVLGQILAATGRFGMYAWSSVFANIISCTGFTVFIMLFGNASRHPIAFWTTYPVALTAGSWTLGVAVQALVLFIPLTRIGLKYRIRWGIHGLGLRSMGRVAAWSLAITVVELIVGMVISQINTGAPNVAGNQYNTAGNGSYQYAYSLFILPYSLIAVSLTTAVFPRLARAITERHYADAHNDLFSGIRLVSLAMLFFTAALIVMPVPIIRALLPSVNMHEAILIAGPLIGMSAALLPASVFLLAQRTFYAFEDGKSTFVVAAVQLGTQTLMMLIGMQLIPAQWWAAMVGWTLALSNIAAMPCTFILLRRRFLEAEYGGIAIRPHITGAHIAWDANTVSASTTGTDQSATIHTTGDAATTSDTDSTHQSAASHTVRGATISESATTHTSYFHTLHSPDSWPSDSHTPDSQSPDSHSPDLRSPDSRSSNSLPSVHTASPAYITARTLGIGCCAAIAAGVCGWFVLQASMHLLGVTISIHGVMPWLQAVGLCIIVTAVMAAVYVGMLWICKIDEITRTAALVRRKLHI